MKTPLAPHLTLADLERDSATSQVLSWVPETAVFLPEGSMPWAGKGIDRVLAWLPEDLMALLEDGLSAETAQACLHDLNGYSFDGEMAFIPQEHAEHFWQFLTAYMQEAVRGNTTLHFEGQDIEIEENLLTLGDSTCGIFGMPSSKGLWVVFAESNESFGTPFIGEALAHYPGNETLRPVLADALRRYPLGVDRFDPGRAWVVIDSHLADHLHPDRATEGGAQAFFAFLEGAIEEGVLGLDCLAHDVDGKPWDGRRVAIAGKVSNPQAIGRVLESLGGKMVEAIDTNTTQVIFGEGDIALLDRATELNIPVMVVGDFTRLVLAEHAKALQRPAHPPTMGRGH